MQHLLDRIAHVLDPANADDQDLDVALSGLGEKAILDIRRYFETATRRGAEKHRDQGAKQPRFFAILGARPRAAAAVWVRPTSADNARSTKASALSTIVRTSSLVNGASP